MFDWIDGDAAIIGCLGGIVAGLLLLMTQMQPAPSPPPNLNAALSARIAIIRIATILAPFAGKKESAGER